MRTLVGEPFCWPLERWPERDQAAWVAGCTPGDPFRKTKDGTNYGSTLRAPSLAKAREGYGRWLSFLHSQNWIDPGRPALERVTQLRLCAYFQELRANGNADYTIIGRFQELSMALKILSPGCDTSWTRRLGDVSVYVLLPKTKRQLMVPDGGVSYYWAMDMMDSAKPSSFNYLTTYRDGLLLAMFAARGRRLRSMALLRVDKELTRLEDRYWIKLTPEQVKTNKRDRFNLPNCLTSYIQHYLDVIRPALLKGRPHDALWISRHGDPMKVSAIETRVQRLTLKRFGQGFGPHRFRHSIATTALLRDPGHPGVAAGLLGVSADVVEQHYNRAEQIQATEVFSQVIERRREKAKALPQ